MKIGKVIGKVVSSRKEGKVEGLPILVVSYLDETLSETGKTAACIDTVNAGQGDVVLLCASSSARMTSKTTNVATDNTIVGILDSVSAGSTFLYKRTQSRGDR
jgi:ethanolamine utilization protein EutN